MVLFRYTWRTFSREICLLLGAIAFCIPIYLLASTSLKTNRDLLRPLSLPSSLHVSNYSVAWHSANLAPAFLYSLIITMVSLAGLIFLGSLCAWTLSRHRSKLSSLLYGFFVVGIVLPLQLAIIPVYVGFVHAGLTGTVWGVVLFNVGFFMPFTVFTYLAFFAALPTDYEEAALVDGARPLRRFFRVVFPLMRPATGTVAVILGVATWNNFFAPVIFLAGSGEQTLPVTIYSFASEVSSQWNLIFAAILIAIFPMIVFYVFAQRQLIRSFSSGIRG